MRAQEDSDDGTLSPERRLIITDGTRAMIENLSDDEAADTTNEDLTQSLVESAENRLRRWPQ